MRKLRLSKAGGLRDGGGARRGSHALASAAPGVDSELGTPPPTRDQRASARGDLALLIAAAAVVIVGVVAALLLSPRVPFADAWRHYTRLLEEPFLIGILTADNGHPEVFANLVRYLSLTWLHGDELTQTVIGMLLALATLALMLRIVWCDGAASFSVRAVSTFALSLGLFWLGNGRALLHNNEALHVYSATVCVAAAMRVLIRRSRTSPTDAQVLLATLFCFCASFCFGSGIADFAAAACLLFVARAPLRHYAIVIAGAALAFTVYRMLPGAIGRTVALQPLTDTAFALRWLATPWIYLVWPFVDMSAAAAAPHALQPPLLAFAGAWTRVFGDIHTSTWPQLALGIGYAAALAALTWRARRSEATLTGRVGLALAWFGLAVAGLIGLARADYFAEFPLQLHVPRYLPWQSLGWTGLLVAWLAHARMTRAKRVAVALIGAAGLMAEVGMTKVMLHQRSDADRTALAAIVGVLDDRHAPSENDADEVRRSAAALQRTAAGPFAAAEAGLIGAATPAAARELPAQWTTRTVNDAQSLDLEARVDDANPRGRYVLVSCEGRVTGLLQHRAAEQWAGVSRPCAELDSLRIAELPK